MAGVIRRCGISMANSSSTASIRLTMSSEVRPASVRFCSREIEVTPERLTKQRADALDPKRSDVGGPKGDVGGAKGNEARQPQAETPTTHKHRL